MFRLFYCLAGQHESSNPGENDQRALYAHRAEPQKHLSMSTFTLASPLGILLQNVSQIPLLTLNPLTYMTFHMHNCKAEQCGVIISC